MGKKSGTKELKKSKKGPKSAEKGSKGGPVKASKNANSVVPVPKKCISVKLIKGKVTITVTGDANGNFSPLRDSKYPILELLCQGKAALHLWSASKKFKDSYVFDGVKRYITTRDLMEAYFSENARINDEEMQADFRSLHSEASKLHQSYIDSPQLAISNNASIGSFFGLSNTSFYTSLNPKWEGVFGGLMQEILQGIQNEEREEKSTENNSNFVTGSACSLVSFFFSCTNLARKCCIKNAGPFYFCHSFYNAYYS